MRYAATAAVATFAATALAAISGAALAQQEDRPEQLDGRPNLNGIWRAMGSAHWNLEPHEAERIPELWELGAFGAIPAGMGVVEGGEIPFLPEAADEREANRAGWPDTDPVQKCYLPGIPRATYMPFPFQIVQGGAGDDILMVYEYASANRLIHMSDWIAPPVDTWMGRSNGLWEYGTLVVETTGFNGETWLDRSGVYTTPMTTVTERFTLVDDSHIRYEATIEDPSLYSRAWTISMPLYRDVEPNAQLLEFKCVPFVEELLYKDLELSSNGAPAE